VFFSRKAAKEDRLWGNYDLLYIHRRLFSPLEFACVRRRAKKIVFDFDDASCTGAPVPRTNYSFSRCLKFAFMMRRVDFVAAGNDVPEVGSAAL